VKQRIDIALVRLVHQFVMCGNSIQQAMTDIQVRNTEYFVGKHEAEYFINRQEIGTFLGCNCLLLSWEKCVLRTIYVSLSRHCLVVDVMVILLSELVLATLLHGFVFALATTLYVQCLLLKCLI